MLRCLIILLCLQFFYDVDAIAHDIHVSVIEVREKTTGEFDISVRIFLDDLMNACGLTPGEALPEGYSSSDDLIEKYLEQHLQFTVDGERQTLIYKESNADLMSVWIELSLKNQDITETSHIQIENTILLDLFDDQLNLFHVNRAGKRKSYSFSKKEKSIALE